MAIRQVIPVSFAVQYTGTNSAEVITYATTYWAAGSITACTIKTETGGVLTLNVDIYGGAVNDGVTTTATIHTGDWLTPSLPWRGAGGFDSSGYGLTVVPNASISQWLSVLP